MTFKIQDLVIVVAFLIVVGVTYFLAMPQADHLKTQVIELASSRNKLVLAQAKLDSLNALTTELAQRRDDIGLLDIALPKDTQIPEAMIQVQTMAQKAGVTMISANPSQGKSGILPVSLSIKGTYPAMATFLRELNSNLRPVTIKSFSLAAQDPKEASIITANLSTGLEYSAADETTASAAAGAAAPVPTP